MLKNIVAKTESSETNSAMKQGQPPAADGTRRRYTPPRLLSSEPLELSAGTCDGTAGYGKDYPKPPCLQAAGS